MWKNKEYRIIYQLISCFALYQIIETKLFPIAVRLPLLVTLIQNLGIIY